MKKRILLIATVYRVGERIYPIIPSLSEFVDIDVLLINEMSDEMKWYGDNDLRKKFHLSYDKYFENKFNCSFYSTEVNPDKLLLDLDMSVYDLVLYDDNRNRYGIHFIYEKCKQLGITMIGCTHGTVSRNFAEEGYEKVFDKMFVFGDREYDLFPNFKDVFIKGGVPSNDYLSKYKKSDDYILVIVNYLGNRGCPFSVQVDRNFITRIGLLELQKEFNKKVVFKLKSRSDHPYPQKDIDYLKKIVPFQLEYEYIIDCEDDNLLISNAFLVISAPGTMALKPIQKGIPTILIKDSGQNEFFEKFKGLKSLDTQDIFDEIERQHNHGRDDEFISEIIEGGDDYNSTEIFIKKLKDILYV